MSIFNRRGTTDCLKDDDDDKSYAELNIPEFRSLNLVSEPLIVVRNGPEKLIRQVTDSPWFPNTKDNHTELRSTHIRSCLVSNTISHDNTIKLKGTPQQPGSDVIAIDDSDETFHQHRPSKCIPDNENNTNDKTPTSRLPESDICYGWSNPNFARISRFHQISKYNTEVKVSTNDENGASPQSLCTLQNVMNELYNMFREQSLEVHFANEPTATVRCEASCGLVFNIVFWQQSSSCSTTTSTDASYLIEVDYVSGDSIDFHSHYAQLVLETVNMAAAGAPQTSRLVVSDDDCYMEDNLTSDTEFEAVDSLLQVDTHNDSLSETLAMVGEMVTSSRYDMVLRGLDVLEQLTNPNVSGWITASRTSRIVLLGCDSSGDIGSTSVGYNRSAQERIRRSIHSMALVSSFHNATEPIHVRKSLLITTQSILLLRPIEVPIYKELAIDRSVVDALFQYLYSACTSPYMAELATRILTVLVQNDRDMMPMDDGSGACNGSTGFAVPTPSVTWMCRSQIEQLHLARTFGSYHHLGLERATHHLVLLASMGN